MTRGMLGAALGCVGLAWLLLALGDGRVVAHAEARLRAERAAAHIVALRAVAARLAGLEAVPPELLARTLAEVAQVSPEWSRLVVCDAAGRVLAAEPKRDTALVGALDPSEARRGALAGAAAGATFEHARGGATELGVASVGRYVAGDLADGALAVRLESPPLSARVIASWALAVIAALFTAAGLVISSKRRS